MKNALFTLFIFCFNIIFSQSIIIDEDFESTAIGNVPSEWTVTNPGSGIVNQKVVDNPVKNGNHAFQLSAASNIASLRTSSLINLPDKITLESWMNADAILGGNSGAMGLVSSSNAHIGIGILAGNIHVWDGSQNDIQSYTINTWYHIKIEYDFLNSTFQAFINGELASYNDNGTTVNIFSIPTSTAYDKIYLNAGNSGNINVYFDDVKLYKTNPNLVAYYPFNGNANDESGNGNHGTVNGATLITDRFGNKDSAYSFDGSSEYITIPNNENINIADGESYSVSFWLKHNAQNNGKYMISKYATLSEPSYAIGTGSDGDSYSWHGFSNSFDTGIESRGSIDLNDNAWHQITSIFKSGESVSLYVDGVLDVEHTISHTASITNSRELTIGCNADLTRFYNGYIDDIKIYNKALTVQEIKNESQSLVAHYPFNGNANDESGNGNHGVNYGANLTEDKDGNENSAYLFDGVDDYIDIGDWENGGATTFTFWARWDSFNWYSRILDLGNGSSSNNMIVANYRDTGNIFFSVYTSGESAITTSAITQGQWDFFALSYGADGTKTIYKNGTQIDQQVGNVPNYLLRTEQFIGKSNFSNDEYFHGAIDELKIFNKELTSTEVMDVYNLGVTLSTNSTISNKASDFYISNNTLYFKNNQNLDEIKNIEVFNLIGQKMSIYSNITKEIPLVKLKTGIYIAKLNFRNKASQVLKFIYH